MTYKPKKTGYGYKILFFYLFLKKPSSLKDFRFLNPVYFRNEERFFQTAQKLADNGYLKKIEDGVYQITDYGKNYCFTYDTMNS